MFSEQKKGKVTVSPTAQQNTIAKGTTIVGDIKSEGGFRIDGTIEGTITTPGKVVVGKTGVISGTLIGDNADIEGKFSGKLKLTGTLTLRSTAVLDGEVEIERLAVDPGATFNAVCSMKGAVKLSKGNVQRTEKETGKSA